MSEERDQDPIDPRGREKSYEVVARRLLRRIEAGEWPLGARIPSEMELVDWYGVSRTTVRNALKVLKKKNMLEKVSGKGTYLIAQQPEEQPED